MTLHDDAVELRLAVEDLARTLARHGERLLVPVVRWLARQLERVTRR